jgi:DNA-binding NtrC family response regulator
MIGVDGMMLLDRIKTAPHLEKIPVIMQTGEAEFEEHVNAVRAGVFDFIYKPVSEELLLFVVGNAINEDL